MLPQDPDNVWNWYDSFYRMHLQTYAMDTSVNNFSWANDLGLFFLDENLAYSKLDEVLNPEYRVCTSQNRESSGDALDEYPSFHNAANNCGYIGIDATYLNDMTLYLTEQEGEEEYVVAITFNQDGTGDVKTNLDEQDQAFDWQINSNGIVELVFKDGNTTNFAYIASNEDYYSFLGFHYWEEEGIPYRSIEDNVFSTSKPYSVCYRNDTEWDVELDRPVANATLEEFQATVADCGGQMNFTQEMVAGMVLYDYNEGKDRLRVWEFKADGVVTRTQEDIIKTWHWNIDENGYIFIDIAEQDFEYIALMGIEDNKYSLKIFSQYPESQDSVIAEIFGTEFSSTNPRTTQTSEVVLPE
ncbi:hypothetical protein JCM19241_1135 [Vibrio ishigakensis]|uniref:Uncharacterized protein n=1 Tax=Vibrio ishigakensis TaxID=1481914 RepID=A0A0B8QCY7_9VIBR|nr:hypothetical protein JCM19241_1135 [Vibrio ishigakensis]